MKRFLMATLPVLLVPVIPLALATSCTSGGFPGAAGPEPGATGGAAAQGSPRGSGGATATAVGPGTGGGSSGSVVSPGTGGTPGATGVTPGGNGGTPGDGTGGTSGVAGQSAGDTTASGVGPQFLPCTPSHIITAHGQGSTTTKYPVPNPTSDAYVCFNFKSPFAAGEQATAFAPIIDDDRVIHHWILYGSTTSVADGAIQANCVAPSASAVHVTGWAPGGQNAVLDPDVGLKLDYPYFLLQIHYNNQRYADGADASGVAICSTTTPRTNEAGIVTLGPGFFSIPAKANDYPVTASCTGGLATDGKTPITIIGTSPHMHLLGA